MINIYKIKYYENGSYKLGEIAKTISPNLLLFT